MNRKIPSVDFRSKQDPKNYFAQKSYNPNGVPYIGEEAFKYIFPNLYCAQCLVEMEVKLLPCYWNCPFCVHDGGSKSRVCMETKFNKNRPYSLYMSRPQVMINFRLFKEGHLWLFRTGFNSYVAIHHGNQNPYDDREQNLSLVWISNHSRKIHFLKDQVLISKQASNTMLLKRKIVDDFFRKKILVNLEGKHIPDRKYDDLFFMCSEDKNLLKEYLEYNKVLDSLKEFNEWYSLWYESKVILKRLVEKSPEVVKLKDDEKALEELAKIDIERQQYPDIVQRKT